jgi:hypothetical protein
MKGKILLFLFALPFAGVGVWMAYSIGATVHDAWQMRSWVPVEASVTRAGYETHAGDDSNTYEAYADYSYAWNDQAFAGHRVSISGGADNIGDYQTDMGNRLSAARTRGESIVVYVDPQAPQDSIVDRDLRWGLLGFKSIFLLVFGGVGFGLIYFLFRSPVAKAASAGNADRPWLDNEDWQSPEVRSNSKAAMYFTWGFAAFWNLVSAPLPFVIHGEVLEKQNYAALIGLLFPLVGIGMLVWAVRRTLEWLRFGAAPLKLDPFPGAIGGHVGGTIDLKLPYDAGHRFSLTLTNLHSYVSGSGKNRSRRETARWQDTQLARASVGSGGTRLGFRFDVPQGLEESDVVRSSDLYTIWRLSLNADLPGVDVDRDYEIPVYATAEKSRHLAELSLRTAADEQSVLDLEAVRKVAQFDYDAAGRSMRYPMGRNLLSALGGLVCGAIFAGAGWFLLMRAGHPLMGSIFGAVGLLIFLSAFYFLFNSLEIVRSGGEMRTVRRILGIPVRRRQMRCADVVRIEKKSNMQTQSAGKHVMHYTIYAVGRDGAKIVLGEGFKGAGRADAAARLIAQEFDLPALLETAASDAEAPDVNLLADH